VIFRKSHPLEGNIAQHTREHLYPTHAVIPSEPTHAYIPGERSETDAAIPNEHSESP
jgi:hypothetical protein